MPTAWIPGRVTRRHAWNATHFSLFIECDRPDFAPGQFVRLALDIEGERVARPYSCVNPPHRPGLEIFFNRVPDGPLSSRLATLAPGDAVWVSGAANGLLTLGQVPADARDLWMLATGTGVGPFLSILQSEVPWQRFERLILAYGVRDLGNYAYGELLDQLVARQRSRLRVIPCVTGEQPLHGYHGRITSALRSGMLENLAGRDVDAQHSHFLLCGNDAMIQEVSELLRERGLKRNLRSEPGQFSSEKYH
jgi:ferredoxin/flavodoxin---NADP+ reductase